MIFSPQFIYMVYHIDCFAVIELSLYLWDKSYLIMVYDQLILNLVAKNWPVIFSFFSDISVWFWVMQAS